MCDGTGQMGKIQDNKSGKINIQKQQRDGCDRAVYQVVTVHRAQHISTEEQRENPPDDRKQQRGNPGSTAVNFGSRDHIVQDKGGNVQKQDRDHIRGKNIDDDLDRPGQFNIEKCQYI